MRFKSLTSCSIVEKKKKDLIHRAKVKKAYAKIKAQENTSDKLPDPAIASESASEREAEEQKHEPESTNRESEAAPEAPDGQSEPPRRPEPAETRDSAEPDPNVHPARQRNLRRRPGYFDRSLQESSKRKAQREAREAEFQRRREERERRIKERQRFRRVSAKAREVGPDGRRKLGRESEVLLERVKRMVGKS